MKGKNKGGESITRYLRIIYLVCLNFLFHPIRIIYCLFDKNRWRRSETICIGSKRRFENRSKIWNEIFSQEISSSRKSSLKFRFTLSERTKRIVSKFTTLFYFIFSNTENSMRKNFIPYLIISRLNKKSFIMIRTGQNELELSNPTIRNWFEKILLPEEKGKKSLKSSTIYMQRNGIKY